MHLLGVAICQKSENAIKTAVISLTYSLPSAHKLLSKVLEIFVVVPFEVHITLISVIESWSISLQWNQDYWR